MYAYEIETAHMVLNFARRLMATYLPSAWPGLIDIQIERAREHVQNAINAAGDGKELSDARKLGRSVRDCQARYDRVTRKEAALRPSH